MYIGTQTDSSPDCPRIVLNFATRCALRCEWCYVPFDRPAATLQTTAAIVERVASLGFTSITFGGGDPFQYAFIETILRQAKTAGLFVHVDTHAKGLHQTRHSLSALKETVDLLGLPLDGATPVLHDRMRSVPGHFELIQRRLDWLRPILGRVKINTLLSALNVEATERISHLVASIRPSRWSIYQYWPLGPARQVESLHMLDNAVFRRAAEHAAAIASAAGVVVEITCQEDRRSSYPIVQHDGLVLVHTEHPQNELVSIGSIFDTGVLDRIHNECSGERLVAITRYPLRRESQSSR